jgi:hypothetical protein
MTEGTSPGPPLIATPRAAGPLTNAQILSGKYIAPLERIQTFTSEEWEEFVREWATGLDRYKEIRRASGANDGGRDVIACVGPLNSQEPWDNYQCKHYSNPLTPGDVWIELGKLCYHTWQGHYTIPRRYYFVAPRGVGPTLLQLLQKPAEIKSKLIEIWPKQCETCITTACSTPLDGELKEFVEQFDFSIVGDIPPAELIEQHRQTRYHAARFGGGLVRPRIALAVPDSPELVETRYVEQLLSAYTDHLKCAPLCLKDLESHIELLNHFRRQRKHFYEAESLRNFSRDNLPEGRYFEELQEEIFIGIADTIASPHPSGYERVKKALEAARNLQITSHPLLSELRVGDRHGICHQLANEDRLKWVP